MNAAKRLEIFRRLHEDNPDPKTELSYTTPFELLIAVMLSAQATDKGVNKATAKLFPVANTPETLHALGVDGLSAYINTINFYNTKAHPHNNWKIRLNGSSRPLKPLSKRWMKR